MRRRERRESGDVCSEGMERAAAKPLRKKNCINGSSYSKEEG